MALHIRHRLVGIAAAAFCTLAAAAQADTTVQSLPASRRGAAAHRLAMPFYFEANRGQFDSRARFVSRSGGRTLFLTPSEAVMVLPGRSRTDRGSGQSAGAVLRMELVGAGAPAISGLGKLPGRTNYFRGNDPRKWVTNVPTYKQVRYASVYPGTDLVFYESAARLEYDFILKPGADPRRIGIALRGADRVQVAASGDLVATTAAGSLTLRRPYAYQVVAGRRVQVACSYIAPDAGSGRAIRFHVARYDTARPLVVDPVVEYSTLIGGGNDQEDIWALAVNAAGEAYVAGFTSNSGFPTTAGAYQTTFRGGTDPEDAFVAKFNATGSGLIYSTLLGGATDGEEARALAIDADGNAYVTGDTYSSDFPGVGGLGRVNSGACDTFITKLNPTGSGLVYSGYVGGIADDYGRSIAVDSAGAAYVFGDTRSNDFPTGSYALKRFLTGYSDAFVYKIMPSGAGMDYCTLVGGSGSEYSGALAVDPSGAATVVGSTESADFPTTAGACQSKVAGDLDAFVARLNPSGSALEAATCLGGTNTDNARAVALDAAGSAYVTGCTESSNFPTTAGAYMRYMPEGAEEPVAAFVAKVSPDAKSLAYSTLLIGSEEACGNAIAVTSTGEAYVAGAASDGDFPTTPDAIQGSFDAWGAMTFLSRFSADGSQLAFSTFLGGLANSEAHGLALGSAGTLYLAGYSSGSFATTAGAFQTGSTGYADPYLMKLNMPARTKDATRLTLSRVTTQPGKSAAISLKLAYSATRSPVAGARVAVKVEGQELPGSPVTTRADGTASLLYKVPSETSLGTYEMTALYAGSSDNASSSGSAQLVVESATKLYVAATAPSAPGSTIELYAYLHRTCDGKPLSDQSVAFSFAGEYVGGANTDADGRASLLFTVPAATPVGDVEISAAYGGASYLQGSSRTSTATILSTVPAAMYTASASGGLGAPIPLTAFIWQLTPRTPLSGLAIDFYVDGALVGSGVSDSDGRATYAWMLPEGTPRGSHTLVAKHAVSATYGACSASSTVTTSDKYRTALFVGRSAGSAGQTTYLYAYLYKLANGEMVQGKAVNFTVDGVDAGTGLTDGTGCVTIAYQVPDGASVGDHAVRASFGGEAIMDPASSTGNLTVKDKGDLQIFVPSYSCQKGGPVKLYTYIRSAAGRQPLSGLSVKWTMDGNAIGSAVTNSEGYAKIIYNVSAGFASGNHTVAVECAGNARYNAGTASSSFTVP